MSRVSGFARLWAAVAAVLAVLLGVTVAMARAEDADDPAGRGDPAAAAETVTVTLTEFAVDPAELTVPADRPVVFEVINDGSVPHDFVIDGVAETELLDAGASATLEVAAFPAGSYDAWCSVAGHEGAGMHATVTAVDGGGDGGNGGGSDGGGDADGAGDDLTPEELAAMHDDLSAFPEDTEGQGNQPLEPEITDDGVKVFELTAEHVEWEVEPGEVREAMAYNGQVPGPRIDVDLGDEIRVVLHNELDVPTSLHLHGLVLPNEMDGVPGLTQDSVLPGESFTYELTVTNAGSHMYHSHFDSADQVPGGLLGAFVVHGDDEPEVDHDVVMILNDGPLGYTINGKGFPATEPVVVEQGDRVRVRYMNEGLESHPMHLHGMPQQIIARDGYALEAPVTEDNVLVAPGDRLDVLVEATEPGAWAWHCHILTHAEGAHGMFGMVTALIVE